MAALSAEGPCDCPEKALAGATREARGEELVERLGGVPSRIAEVAEASGELSVEVKKKALQAALAIWQGVHALPSASLSSDTRLRLAT